MAMPSGSQEPFNLERMALRILRELGGSTGFDHMEQELRARKLIAAIPPECHARADLSFAMIYLAHVQQKHETSLKRGRRDDLAGLFVVRDPEPAPQPAPELAVKEPLVRGPQRPDGAKLWYQTESLLPESGPASVPEPAKTAAPAAPLWRTGGIAPVPPAPKVAAGDPPAKAEPEVPAVIRRPELSGKVQAIRAAWPQLDNRLRGADGAYKRLGVFKAADLRSVIDTLKRNGAQQAAKLAVTRANEESHRSLLADLVAFGGEDAVVEDLPPEVLARNFQRRIAS